MSNHSIARRQATLPENLEGPTIATMATGETAYTVPWAMWVDNDRHCWLQPAFPAESEPGGTVQMRVELQRDGYHVWPTTGHRYSPEEEPGIVTTERPEYIPVAELHIWWGSALMGLVRPSDSEPAAECLMCGTSGGQQCADWRECKITETLAEYRKQHDTEGEHQ